MSDRSKEDYANRSERDTEIEFPEFAGWRFHAGGAGKTIAIALVRRAADDA